MDSCPVRSYCSRLNQHRHNRVWQRVKSHGVGCLIHCVVTLIYITVDDRAHCSFYFFHKHRFSPPLLRPHQRLDLQGAPRKRVTVRCPSGQACAKAGEQCTVLVHVTDVHCHGRQRNGARTCHQGSWLGLANGVIVRNSRRWRRFLVPHHPQEMAAAVGKRGVNLDPSHLSCGRCRPCRHGSWAARH